MYLRRMAFTLIELLVVLGIVGILVGILLPAVQRVRESANRTRCVNNLHQFGLAIHHYHDAQGSFPAGYIENETTNTDPSLTSPGWGWAYNLLPYLEQESLQGEFHASLPVESPINEVGRLTSVKLFVCPSDQNTGVFTLQDSVGNSVARAATNSYAACFGALGEITDTPDQGNGIFFRNSHVRFADILDGTSRTLAIGERGALLTQTPWAGAVSYATTRVTPGAPTTSTAMEGAPTQTLAHTGSHPLNDPASDPDDFFSPHTRTAQFLFADGSSRALDFHTALSVMKALSTRAGGEPLADGNF